MGGCDIKIWARTGIFLPRETNDKSCDAPSRMTKNPEDFEYQVGGNSSENSQTELDPPDNLSGADDDLLKPSNAEINLVYYDGRETWMQFVREAEGLAPNSFPEAFGDPYIMLKDVPPLPTRLSKSKVLYGQPVWFLPDAEKELSGESNTENANLQYPLGVRKEYWLSSNHSTKFAVFPSQINDHLAADGSTGLLVLTLCWSYIFSVRLLEIQNREVMYSPGIPKPISTKEVSRARKAGHVILSLTGDSVPRQMILWLRAILAPKLAWHPADNRGFPPWTATCPESVHFAFHTDEKYIDYDHTTKDSPPNSTEATELLVQFCELFGLGKNLGAMPPPTTAFLATVMIPFCGGGYLMPRFAIPKLRRQKKGMSGIGDALCNSIRQYTIDLNYFMTLRLEFRGAGSILWSIFWQPEIACNLVSAWFRAIHDVIRPVLEDRDMQKLVKIFAVRRSRAAMWWMGIYALGGLSVLEWISRYLEKGEERYGFGTMSSPDPVMAVWTGIPNSYLDDDSNHPYKDLNKPVQMVHLMRHRYNFRLQDNASRLLSWRPFGTVPLRFIEPDLWPWLKHGN